MIKFNWPYLLVLFPLPYLLNYFAKKAASYSQENINNKTNLSEGLYMPFYSELLNSSNYNTMAKSNKISLILLVKSAIWLLLILSIMRPVFIDKLIALPIPAHDIIMAIDISGSMAAEDMSERTRQTRLDVVKNIAHEFIEKRQADRMGLIFFGSQAFVSSPLTLDQKSLHSFLDKTQIGFAGQRTAIGDAIGLGIKRLESGNNLDNTRFIILLSDGSNTSGDVNPLEAAKVASENKIKIYTIGIGKNSQNIFDIQSGMDLDEETLKAIAKTTNGKYFHATSSNALARIYNEINTLEANTEEIKTLRPEIEYFIYPLLLAFSLSLLLALTNKQIL